jgi:hypothetical protein
VLVSLILGFFFLMKLVVPMFEIYIYQTYIYIYMLTTVNSS